jgi:hypothetical protein
MSSKYRNVKTVVDGIVFDSKREANRYGLLKLRQRLKEIRNLRCHVLYTLAVNDVAVCKYEADFVYEEGNGTVVEDVKGVRTAVYKLKKKLMKACLGIEIREV